MKRRHFLQSISCLTASQFIPAFVRMSYSAEPPAPSLEFAKEHMLMVTFGGRIATAEDDKNSEIAKSVYDEWVSSGRPNNLKSREMYRNWVRSRLMMQNAKAMDVMQAAQIARTLAPVTHYLDGAYNQHEEFGGATGASVVDAGSQGVSDFSGYCMDPIMSAPQKNEPLRLFDIDRLVGNQYAPYFRALAALPEVNKDTSQALIWKMRNLLRDRLTAQSVASGGLDPELKAALNNAIPNGAKKFIALVKSDVHANAIPDFEEYDKVGSRLAATHQLLKHNESPYTLMRPGGGGCNLCNRRFKR